MMTMMDGDGDDEDLMENQSQRIMDGWILLLWSPFSLVDG